MSFDEFWAKYPRKVAKKAARKAWNGAIKVASAEKIMAGLEQYIVHKPAWKDWMHPATYLNGERWDDEYDEPMKLTPRTERMGSQVYCQRRGWISLDEYYGTEH